MSKDGHVLVAGAGPVGILNALGLARAGIPVTVLERSPGVVPSPRAMVYHWSVLDGLERLGVYDAAVARGFLKQDYTYKVHKTGEEINYGLQSLEGLVRHPTNLHLGQHVLVEVALEALAAYPHAEVLWDHKLVSLTQDGDGVTVVAQAPDGPRSLRGSWLIGADGARSAVREALGIEFEGFTWPERFVATNVRYPFEAKGFSQTTMLIDDAFGAIISKIDNSGETGLWRYTYCEDASLPEEGVLERLPRFLQEVLPDQEGFELDAHSPYRMHQRAATRFRDGRVLLAGDAAHSTNPTGGLGLTSGLFDTYVLQEALAAVIKGEAEESVLDEYARERRRVFVEVASPAASNNKRLVYHSTDPARLEQDLTELRALETDHEAVVRRLMFPKSLETRSLVGAW
ncbi:NAD(P)/FAD-dependent oxidoreductase [Georgenia sp. SYP-B2076]|uniref:FAD-dependent oxidoreductase n=1 Tax=Georgenia sp. SYP-B2076 TaxID=2495881 RepID=UPI000F8D4E18|nr:FAD-dependent monooxygenase [Georgenia sp. SYP-B2076]